MAKKTNKYPSKKPVAKKAKRGTWAPTGGSVKKPNYGAILAKGKKKAPTKSAKQRGK